MNKINGPTLEDFIEEARAMESAIRAVGDISPSDKDFAQEEVFKCREMALGIIAIAHSYMEDFAGETPIDSKLTYCLACTVAFAQGATITHSLIAQSQYMKAAAAMKQDIEFVAQFRDIVEGRTKKGRTPQMSSVCEWGRRSYGELNKIAHPSNLGEMHSVLSSPSGHFSILPVRQQKTESALYKVHVWNCAEMAAAAVELLGSLATPSEPMPEERLNVFTEALEQLSYKVVSLIVRPEHN